MVSTRVPVKSSIARWYCRWKFASSISKPTLRASLRTMAESVCVWQVKQVRVLRKVAEVRSMSRTARVAASRTRGLGVVEIGAGPDVVDAGLFSLADAV